MIDYKYFQLLDFFRINVHINDEVSFCYLIFLRLSKITWFFSSVIIKKQDDTYVEYKKVSYFLSHKIK